MRRVLALAIVAAFLSGCYAQMYETTLRLDVQAPGQWLLSGPINDGELFMLTGNGNSNTDVTPVERARLSIVRMDTSSGDIVVTVYQARGVFNSSVFFGVEQKETERTVIAELTVTGSSGKLSW